MNENTEYEIFVKEIYEKVLEEEKLGSVFNVEHNKTIVGKSGTSNQIDIYFEKKVAGIMLRVAIECKNYSSRVPIEKIRAFKSVLEEIGAQGIFVSREGFQSGALTFAEHHGITLREVRFPKLEDWGNLVREIQIKLQACQSVIKNRKFQPDRKWFKENYSSHGEEVQFKFGGNNSEFFIRDESGNILMSLYELENKVPTLVDDKTGIKVKKFEFSEAYIEDLEGNRLKIESIEFEYEIAVLEDIITVNGEDSVKGILKDPRTQKVDFIRK